MNAKKYNKILQKVKNDVMIPGREFFEVVKYLNGRVENGSGSCKKVYLENKVITIHLHNNNDFITRETWKLMGLR